MAGRSFRFSGVLAVMAATGFGCAEGASENGDIPPLDGIDTGSVSVDSSGGEVAVDSGPKTDSTVTDTGSGDGSGGDGSGCDPSKGLTISCGVGECTVTMPACSETGAPNTCKPKDPGVEVCNGKDDDCNGTADDGIAPVTCGSGVCANTAPGCVGGVPGVCIPKDLGIESCGVGECVNFVSKCIGGVPQTCMPKPTKVETCNGKDDDCNGTDDDGPPLTMCPPPAGGTVTLTSCTSGMCKIATCAVGKADVDGNYANGCECTDKLAPSECTAPYDMGTVAVGAFQEYKTANLPVTGRSVWVKVTFLNARSNKISNPRLELRMAAPWTGTPAEQPLVMDIITGGTCSGSAPACGGSGEGSATNKTDFNFRYNPGLAGNYTDPAPPGGVKPFQPILPGSDENATVFVRVYNKTGATLSCADFVLTARN
jgi:hypothetical protein